MSLIGLYLLLTVITSRSDITTNRCTLGAEKSWQVQAEQKVVVSIEAMALPVHNYYKHLLKSMGKVPHDNLLAYMTTLLLLHDTELNPGPLSNNTGSNFPCGTCSEPVTCDNRGVCCDACNVWYHAHCQDIHTVIYECMESSNISWQCLKCGMPNIHPSAFESVSTNETSDHHSVNTSHFSLSSQSSPGPPIDMSSPIPIPKRGTRNMER